MEKANKRNYHLHNSRLVKYARKNRKNATKSEWYMWEFILRRKQLKGYKFKRQRPVLNYIADFMCQDLLLIIEVDGITHEDPQQQIRDQIRQKNLEAAGFTVLRFSDREVLYHMESVKQVLLDWIGEWEDRRK
jgi:very-short-patch-repair endonuclease